MSSHCRLIKAIMVQPTKTDKMMPKPRYLAMRTIVKAKTTVTRMPDIFPVSLSAIYSRRNELASGAFGVRPSCGAFGSARAHGRKAADDGRSPRRKRNGKFVPHSYRFSRFQFQILRLHAGLVFPKTEPSGLVFPHVVHVGERGNFLFQTQRPVAGVHEQPAQAFAF